MTTKMHRAPSRRARRRDNGNRTPAREPLYTPRRGPGKLTVHPMACPRDAHGTPVHEGRPRDRRREVPDVGTRRTRAQALSDLRLSDPGATKKDLRRTLRAIAAGRRERERAGAR